MVSYEERVEGCLAERVERWPLRRTKAQRQQQRNESSVSHYGQIFIIAGCELWRRRDDLKKGELTIVQSGWLVGSRISANNYFTDLIWKSWQRLSG